MLVPGHRLSPIPSWHPSLICVPTGYTLCCRQEEALLTTLSAALMLGRWRDKSPSGPLLPAFLSDQFTLCSSCGWQVAEHILLWTLVDEKFYSVLRPNIRASGLALGTSASGFIAISTFELRPCSNQIGKVGIRNGILDLRKLKPQGVTKQELRPMVTTVCGTAGFPFSSFGSWSRALSNRPVFSTCHEWRAQIWCPDWTLSSE